MMMLMMMMMMMIFPRMCARCNSCKRLKEIPDKFMLLVSGVTLGLKLEFVLYFKIIYQARYTFSNVKEECQHFHFVDV